MTKNEIESVGVLTVATNMYVTYWQSMAFSMVKAVKNAGKITFHVYTDQKDKVMEFSQSLRPAKLCVHEVPNYGWPDATLRRYEMFSANITCLNQELLVHLDADMYIHKDFLEFVPFSELAHGIGLVSHPGFWRPNSTKTKIYRALGITRNSGSWESRSESEAYVPQDLRTEYVCGGTWMGRQGDFIKLIQALDGQVKRDSLKGIVAVWHDESHLNKWAAYNSHTTFSPSFCFVSSYGHLKGIDNLIEAVEKGDAKTR